MRYLDPKNDLTFKKIFCEHPDILMDLLNSLLDFKDGNYIKSIVYLPAELLPHNPLKKNSIVDVRCTDNYERQFIVEMQMLWTDSFTNRVIFNASKAFVKQLDKGFNYSKLHPVYSVNLVNEVFLPQKEGYYHDYRIVNSAEEAHVLDGLSFLFIELPKIKEHNLPKSLSRALWLRFFTEIKDETEAISEELAANPKIKDALDILQESAFTNAELEVYDKYWDIISTERTLREDMMQKLEEARRLQDIAEQATIRANEETARANEQTARANEETARANEETARANEQTAYANEQAVRANEETARANEQTAYANEQAVRANEETAHANQKTIEEQQHKINSAKILLANGISKEIIAISYQMSVEEFDTWLR